MTGLWIGIDPGETNGLAVWDGTIRFDLSGQLTRKELSEFMSFYCSDIRHVQIEKFTITGHTTKTKVNYAPLYTIGEAMYFAHCCEYPIELSTPAQVKTRFSDSALKKAGWYIPGKGHCMDAMRHLALSLTKHRLVDPAIFILEG